MRAGLEPISLQGEETEGGDGGPPHYTLEGIVDAGEDCGAFAAPSYVDEADYERLRDSTDSESADGVHVREWIVAHFMADAARFRERRRRETFVSPHRPRIQIGRKSLAQEPASRPRWIRGAWTRTRTDRAEMR